MLGLAISYSLNLNTISLIFGCIFPEFDLFFRTQIFHSIFFSLIFTILIFLKFKKQIAFSFFIGNFINFLITSLLSKEKFFWPFSKTEFGFSLPYSYIIFYLILSISLAIFLNKNKIFTFLSQVNPKKNLVSFSLLFIIWTSSLIILPKNEITPIYEIIQNPVEFAEKEIITQGKICSPVIEYNTSFGNLYQIFDICENGKIKVWKLKDIQENNISRNNYIKIKGIVTLKYAHKNGIEIYNVSYIKIIK